MLNMFKHETVHPRGPSPIELMLALWQTQACGRLLHPRHSGTA
jgi:hypothetical protein